MNYSEFERAAYMAGDSVAATLLARLETLEHAAISLSMALAYHDYGEDIERPLLALREALE
jgi:hypothetical protein